MGGPRGLDEVRLRRLIDAGRSVVAERELEAVFDRLLNVARELTGARYAALGVLDDARAGLGDFITMGIDPATRAQIGDLPRHHGVLGMLISDPVPLRLDNVGDHPRSYGFPSGHPLMNGFLGVPILIRGEAWGNLYLTDKDGGQFDEADEEAATVLADWAAVAVENARLQREGERHRAQLERSVRALEATSEIARAVGGETKLERVLELIAERSRELVEASGLAILLVDGYDFVVAATAGETPRGIVGSRVSVDGSTPGRVVPMTFRRTNVGVLEAFDRVGGPEFDDDDERILMSAAASAAAAVSTAQTLERNLIERTLRAAEDERRRWARELHDETLQALGGLRVLLVSGRRHADLPSLQSTVDNAVELLRTEILNLRALITELRPASLDDIGLVPALEALIERMHTSRGIEIDTKLDLATESAGVQTRLLPEIETVVYRVVQEALNNAADHAAAQRVAVELSESPTEVRVVVRDDGAGFDPASPTSGFGVAGMRERVALTGGSFEILTSHEGTTVQATVPARHIPLADTT